MFGVREGLPKGVVFTDLGGDIKILWGDCGVCACDVLRGCECDNWKTTPIFEPEEAREAEGHLTYSYRAMVETSRAREVENEWMGVVIYEHI